MKQSQIGHAAKVWEFTLQMTRGGSHSLWNTRQTGMPKEVLVLWAPGTLH